MSIYENLVKNDNIIKELDPRFVINFINGPYLEVTNSFGYDFDISFIDNKTGVSHYRTNISNNCWTKSNIGYFVDWKIIAKRSDGEIFEFDFDLKDKRVFITLESRSIGDTLAWFPYIHEFKKKWDCEVICSTFHNNLFKEKYTDLEFVEPGSVVNGIYAMYKIGWFYDENGEFNNSLNPSEFKTKSLQQTASDILGLDFKHIRANIGTDGIQIEKKKRVGIGFHSTAQTKYWNNPTGWQEVVDYLNSNGYEVMILSKEEDGYMGNYYPKGVVKLEQGSIDILIDVMLSCEFFIGIGSGLSWLSWTLNIPTILISGFSTPVSEFSGEGVFRVFNDSVCNGCYNRYRFDAGDWNWCPDQKGTTWEFICTKSITGKMVIDKICENGLVKNETLCDIMKRNGSDKGLSKHNYTILYYEFFKSMIGENINLFEMGIGSNNVEITSNMGSDGKPGASLRGWKEFFKNANIYGADIDPNIIFEEYGIKTFICDQTDSNSITEMWNNEVLNNLDFDVIIDDGLHEFNANLTFFENSIHKLKRGGYYIIEDVLPYFADQFENIIPELELKYKGLKFTIIHLRNFGFDTYDNNMILIKKN